MLNKFVRVPKAVKGMQVTGMDALPDNGFGRVTSAWVEVGGARKVRVSFSDVAHLLCLEDQVTLIEENQQEAALAIWDLRGDK